MKPTDYQRIEADLQKRRLPRPVKEAVRALLDKKAERIVVLKLRDSSSLTDYLVVCNGFSARQNQALADHVRETLKRELKLRAYSHEGDESGEWILVDYVDFIVNVFLPEARERYALEKLWMDAKRYDFYPAE